MKERERKRGKFGIIYSCPAIIIIIFLTIILIIIIK